MSQIWGSVYLPQIHDFSCGWPISLTEPISVTPGIEPIDFKVIGLIPEIGLLAFKRNYTW
jgi:hypothetical protein